jgi:hypothetical protein
VSQMESDLDAILCAAYRDQAELYARALACCSAENLGQHADGWLPQLGKILSQVATIEGQIATVKVEWHRQGRSPGAELRTCLARVAELLRLLAATINRSIETLEANRSTMIPQLEQVARLRRMQQAYDQTGRVAQR